MNFNRFIVLVAFAVLVAAFITTLPACTSQGFRAAVGAHNAMQTAETARGELYKYLAGDETALLEVESSMGVLERLHASLSEVDRDTDVVTFFAENISDVAAARRSWATIKAAVNARYTRSCETGECQVIPLELVTFAGNVESAYEAIEQAVAANDRTVKVLRYTRLIASILAARYGVIL